MPEALVWIIPGALLIAGWVAFRARSARGMQAADRRSVNLALYRQRLAELETEAGDAPEQEALAVELAARLAADEADQGPADRGESETKADPDTVDVQSIGPGAAIALGVAIAVATIVLYVVFGNPRAELLKDAPAMVESEDPAHLQRVEALLVEHLADHPSDADAWFLLGQAQFKRGIYADAAATFRRVAELAGNAPLIDFYRAQALFRVGEGTFNEEGRAAMERILAADVDQPWAWEMLALDAARRGDAQAAHRALQGLLDLDLPPERREKLLELLENLGADSVAGNEAIPDLSVEADAPTGTELRIDLSFAPRIEPPGDGVVFVIVRDANPGPPLAVRRLSAADLPVAVVITDDDVMLPGRSLADSPQWQIMARFSLTGDPRRTQGDIESEAITLASAASNAPEAPPVTLTLANVVAAEEPDS